MERRTILVTGANGFIGTNLTGTLLERGCAVIALDRSPPRRAWPGYRCAAPGEAAGEDWDLLDFRGDLGDPALLEAVFRRRVDYAVHLAAVSTIQLGAEDARETMRTNVEGTEALLRAAAEGGTLRGLLYASTDKVYGPLQGHAYRETDALAPVDSPYDRSKAAADQLVREQSRGGGVPSVVLRLCNIYGPYDLQADRVVPGAVRAILEGRDCVLRMYRDGDGHIRNFRRDFLYVGDLCRAVWRVLETLDAQGAGSPAWGEAFNLGARRGCPIDEMIRTVQGLLGCKRPPRVELAGALAEIPEQQMDWGKAAAAFGFQPTTPLEEGLRATIEWWRRYLGASGGQANGKEE